VAKRWILRNQNQNLHKLFALKLTIQLFHRLFGHMQDLREEKKAFSLLWKSEFSDDQRARGKDQLKLHHNLPMNLHEPSPGLAILALMCWAVNLNLKE